MKSTVLLPIGLGVLLTGCGQAGAPAADRPEAVVDAAGPVATTGSEVTMTARLGPIHFEYDGAALKLADVPITLPPGYDHEAKGVKLIPAERADLLGQEGCRYGQSGLTETCNVEDEAGLVFALLDRPLSDYRAAFVAQDLGDDLETARIDGVEGFSFTAQAEGSGIEYRFVPLEERTLLVARQFSDGDSGTSPAMRDVIGSLADELAGLSG